MEVEIEKVVKAQKEAQSATEVADREENAHNKESRAQAIADEDARRIAGAKGHQQRTLKRSSSLSESIINRVAEKRQPASQAKNDAYLAKQRDMSKNL